MSRIVHMATIERATEDDNNEYAYPFCNWDAEWDNWEYTNIWSRVTCKRCLKSKKHDIKGGLDE